MRIGIDARLWNETGVGRYIRNLVYNLAKIDSKNEYVLFMRSNDIEEGKWNLENGKWKIVPVDIRWHTVEEQLKFPRILNKENLDLMHFPYFSIPVNYKKPFVITIHDLILNHFPTGKASTLPLPIYKIKRFGYKHVLSQAVKNAKKIIVPLNAVRDDVLQSYKVPESKITVIYEGVDESVKGKAERVKRNPYFLYVGNAYPHKNLERLITAFSQMISNYSQINSNGLDKDLSDSGIKLLLVGKDDYFYKKLREKVEKERLDGIIFKQDVTDEELSGLYKNAASFVSASFMEGFGLPALEAMANSCPVVLSDIPSFQEVCNDSAIYFDPNSTNNITEKMKLVLKLPEEERRELISRGLKRAEFFSWKKMTEETLRVYNSQMVSNDSRINSNK